jgi:uncharacterized protein (TIGR02271 family)
MHRERVDPESNESEKWFGQLRQIYHRTDAGAESPAAAEPAKPETVTVTSTPYAPPPPAEPGNIQLYGEVLRVHKEKVSAGEVAVRKESVTRTETVQVPVTEEHLVIERNAGESGGTGETLRIPLSEERVHINKDTVLKEEYRAGKREVTRDETFTGNVRHERLLVDND